MARPKRIQPTEEWHPLVDTDVALYFRTKYHDVMTGKVKKGALSALVNRLLRKEMEGEIAAAKEQP